MRSSSSVPNRLSSGIALALLLGVPTCAVAPGAARPALRAPAECHEDHAVLPGGLWSGRTPAARPAQLGAAAQLDAAAEWSLARCALALIDAPPATGGVPLRLDLAASVDPAGHGTLRLPSAAARAGSVWRGAAARECVAALRALDPTRFLLLAEREQLLLDQALLSTGVRGIVRDDPPGDFLHEQRAAQWVERRLAIELERRGAAVVAAVERGAVGADHELLPLTTPLAVAGDALLVVVPSPFAPAGGRWCALWAELTTVAADGPEAGRWRAEAQRLDQRQAAAWAGVIATAAAASSPASATWRALPADASGRRGLAWLVSRWPDTLVADLALAADDRCIVELLQRHAATRARGAEPADEAALVAQLERDAWSAIGALVADDALPAELRSAACRRGGAAGSDPSALDAVARTSGGLEAIRARLVVENTLLLEDASAATRWRAFHWLVKCGAAPPGFDPLAPVGERRAALRAAEPKSAADGDGGTR